MEKITLSIEGMSCENCVKAVTKTICAFPGTENVKVDLKAGTACFELDSSKTGLDKIEAAIEEAGFKARFAD